MFSTGQEAFDDWIGKDRDARPNTFTTIHRDELSLLESLAARYCSSIEKGLGKMTPNEWSWWNRYKRVEAAQKDAEQRIRDAKVKREAALSKLTDEEKQLLGVK